MATILRFVNNVGAVRLDLNSETGFVLLRGLDLGPSELEQTWLFQESVDGAVLAGSRRPIVTMQIPILMRKQASWAAAKALMDALRVELDRTTNVLEYRPHGAGVSYLIDTYRSPIPSLFRGQEAPSPAHLLQDTAPMVLTISRDPAMRGAGAHI